MNSIDDQNFEMSIANLARSLEFNEVEWRVQSKRGQYALIIPYKTARTDREILNESGLIWQSDFKMAGNLLMAGIGIWHPDLKQFIWRWDTGSESAMEKEKGHASDAFKRAGFQWGIGVELYKFPVVFKKVENDNEYKALSYKLKEWSWAWKKDNGKVVKLGAKDSEGKTQIVWTSK